ncbi:TetR/AcrR family transcriptional regulator [Streptomyces sp. NPDC005423]|uniref:TetR/AcrR family transcriptional regulator n=1 Tax=Streptomyces sp. NPDC005423 TaxID=3155343 RepID=UPI0033B68AEB
MGHREALLEGAKQCLIDKGYARTTARDIVAASGTNLASIGYHYGSKEALLNEALLQANAEWGEALEKALAAGPDRDAAPHERLEAFWTKVIDLFAEHRRLWAVNFEAVTRMEHTPEVRIAFAKALEEAWMGLGETLLAHLGEDSGQEKDAYTVRAVGSLSHALLTGLMAQWLIDPENAPGGAELSLALRAVAAATSPVPAGLQKGARPVPGL